MAKFLDETGLARFWNNIKGRIGSASQEQVDAWLDDHPEATTTVQQHSLDFDKFTSNVVETIDNKADIDGYYEQMTVGAADNLTGRGDGVAAEYLHRMAGGDADISDGTATILSLKGNTLVWNQLARLTGGSVTRWGLTETKDIDAGTLTIAGTATEAGNFDSVGVANVQGHKYLLRGNSSDPSLVRFTAQSMGADLGGGAIITSTSANATWYYAYQVMSAAVGQQISVSLRPQVFDLTAMFGAGNEPATVEEFEALFPLSYYPYDAGSLLPVRMEGIGTVGFNQWDEVWEVGEISDQTGQNSSAGGRIRAKNFIPCFANTSYYLQSSLSTNDLRLYYYDADKGYIGHTGWLTNGTITTPTGCRYMRFATGGAYGATYNHDICINLSWSGYRNGEYEPYWSAQRAIAASTYFPDGMRSAGSVRDELTATEAITRVGVVDLGTLTWETSATGDTGQYRMLTNGLKTLIQKPATSALLANMTCQKYETRTSAQVYQLYTGISAAADGDILVYDPNYATQDSAAAFKAAMSGVMLYYALATPTTQAIDPQLNLSYKVSDFGTERVMVDETDDASQSAPPVMQVLYGLNAVDTIRRLPTQYISHDSMTQFIAAIEGHFNVTVTETWDDTNQRYDYSIAANVEANGGE